MDYDYEYEYKRNHIPAFGSWDCNDDLPFTQCFESARQAGLLRYSYSEDRDLYVTGDLYDNNVVTPAMIVVPRRKGKAGTGGYPHVKKDAWVVCDYEYDYQNYDDCCDAKQPPSPITVATPPPPPPPPPMKHVKKPKAVDEDLYRISPELLRAKPKRLHPLANSVIISPLALKGDMLIELAKEMLLGKNNHGKVYCNKILGGMIREKATNRVEEEAGIVFKLHAANLCYVKTNASFQRYILFRTMQGIITK